MSHQQQNPRPSQWVLDMAIKRPFSIHDLLPKKEDSLPATTQANPPPEPPMSEPRDLNVVRSALLDLYRRDLNDWSDYLLGSEAWVKHTRLLDAGPATDPGVRECLLAAAAFARRAQSHPDPAVAASYRESLARINRALGC